MDVSSDVDTTESKTKAARMSEVQAQENEIMLEPFIAPVGECKAGSRRPRRVIVR